MEAAAAKMWRDKPSQSSVEHDVGTRGHQHRALPFRDVMNGPDDCSRRQRFAFGSSSDWALLFSRSTDHPTFYRCRKRPTNSPLFVQGT